MTFNWYILFLTALIPLITGFIWYSNMLFGNPWKKASGVDPEQAGGNMALILGLTYFFGLLISASMISIVIHQMHIGSLYQGDENAMKEGSEMMNFLMANAGKFRTFKHGALHGFLSALFFAMPLIAINALFERRGWKYIMIHSGYWALTLMIMGGVICAAF
ncbi:MAG: DUF1761 domain-containing protein [Flavobacteriales bacterium]|nr:DUF1761 domain-containing protein [Flavobacteriales bacterium]